MVAHQKDEISLAERQRLDEICDAFEREWQTGVPANIDEYARRVDGPLAIIGLVELVILDAHYRELHDTRIAQGSKTLIQDSNPAAPQCPATGEASPRPPLSSWQDYVHKFPQLSGIDPPEELKRNEHTEYFVGQRLSTLRHYAAGGLGQIILADDAKLKRRVVVKELQPKFAQDEEHRQRFVREAEITGQLEHPGIVPVYGLGSHADGEPWYVMRWIEGQNLREAIEACEPWQANGQISRQRRALLHRFADVCYTISYAHSKRVIHRDIKPSNIILGEFGETLLVDWGLAKQLGAESEATDKPSTNGPQQADSELTRAGTVLGTARYMSPEQARGGKNSTREASDIYSLGATLYHLLTGHPPRPCSALASIVVDQTPVAQIRERERYVPKPLLAICRKAMLLNPEQRYANAGAMAEDIESALADQSIIAFRASWTTKARRWLQKHRTWAAVCAVIFCLTIVGALATSWRERAHSRVLAAKNETLAKLVQHEQQARISAQRSEKRAGDALAYLTTAIKSPDPNRDGRDVRVVEVLTDAVEHLEQDFADDPEMYARVTRSIGQTYEGLGLYSEARDLLEKSVATYALLETTNLREELQTAHALSRIYWRLSDSRGEELIATVASRCEQHFGAGDPDTLRVRLTIAVFEMESGEVVSAVETMQALQPQFLDVMGAGSPDSISLDNNLANALYFCGRFNEALAISKNFYDSTKKQRGPQSLSSIRAGVNYAAHLLKSDHPEDAVSELERLLDLARLNLGDHHYQTLIVMNELGDCYLNQNDTARGIPLIQECLAISQALYGENHHRTLVAASSLGSVFLGEGDYERAAEQYEKVFNRSKKVRGPNHPDTLTAGNNLASACRLDKRYDIAAALFEEILAAQTQTLGTDHFDTIRSMLNLAATLQEAAKPEDALPHAVRAKDLAESALGPEHGMTQTAQSICGTIYIELGQYVEAKGILEACLKTRLAKMPDHWLRFNTQSALGEALAGLNENDRAQVLLREAYEQLLENESAIPLRARFRVDQARQRLVNFYEATDQNDLVETLDSSGDKLKE